jgi:hypothetical protein
VKEKMPRKVLMQTRKILTFQIHEEIDVKLFKVIFNKDGDFKNTIGFDQRVANDLLYCSRKIQAGRIILSDRRKALKNQHYGPRRGRATVSVLGSPGRARAIAVHQCSAVQCIAMLQRAGWRQCTSAVQCSA